MCGEHFEGLLNGLKHRCVGAPLIVIHMDSEVAGKLERCEVLSHRQQLALLVVC
jgi:hypothetical protein